MELLNEVTTLCCLYLMMCFSDFVAEPATRNICGWAFIGLVSFFLTVHLLFLFGSVCKPIFRCLRRCYYNEKRFEVREAIRAKQEALAEAKAEMDESTAQQEGNNQVECKHKNGRANQQLAVIQEEAEELDSEVSGSLRSDPPLAQHVDVLQISSDSEEADSSSDDSYGSQEERKMPKS